MAGVRLQQLVKRFPDGTVAVSGMSLDVRDGEFLVLVGPSGCGKSTVLRMIAGLESPTTGHVLIGEEDVTELPPGARDVAMVFQNYALYPHFTVRENIAFPLRMRGAPKDEMVLAVRDVSEMLGIGELMDRRPGELSGGQRQRVALARALVRQPAVFLFDEPLSNLDAQVRATTRAEMMRLHQQLRITTIYVTHDQVEAMSMADRVAVMNEGRVEQCAAPLDVYRTPATFFTAAFVGTPAINAVVGRVEKDGGRQRFLGPIVLPVTAPPMSTATIAIRPEHVHLSEAPTALPAEVLLVEPLGPETIVHLKLSTGATLLSRIGGSLAPAVGTQVHLRIDPTDALVYDVSGRLAGRGRM